MTDTPLSVEQCALEICKVISAVRCDSSHPCPEDWVLGLIRRTRAAPGSENPTFMCAVSVERDVERRRWNVVIGGPGRPPTVLPAASEHEAQILALHELSRATTQLIEQID
jgi:hypothetical protein